MRSHHCLLATIALLGACAGDPTATDLTSDALAGTSPTLRTAPSSEQRSLAVARSVTARFHRFDVAYDAGYTFLFMNTCMVDGSPASAGGMGYHYVNPLLLDGTVDPATPEAVLYEPQANGKLRLVALEYVIPETEWTSDTPPELFGQTFTLNAFGLWALHVWLWENNPSGLYAAWNPRVSCDNAPASTAMAHH
jgi:hypothetical protein